VREEQRNLIQRMAAHDRAAGHEFVNIWDERIRSWVYHAATYEKVDEHTQEVWAHLIAGNWLRLLQWNGLYDDEAWHEHSLEAFLKTITIHKVSDLMAAEPPQLPPGLDPVDIIDETTPLGQNPLVLAERSRLMKAFDRCMRWFNEKDHRAIFLWWEGHTAQHIADELETNPNNVYQRRSYLLGQLRKCLVEKLPEYFHHV
jgi:DNA-directed RNA polymerase specialized sigma24 family protein